MHILKIILPLILFISSAVAEDFENFDMFFHPNMGLTHLSHFLQNGSDPSSTDKKGNTLLQSAILNNDIKAVALLLQHKAEVNIEYQESIVNGRASSKKIAPLIKITAKTLHISLQIVELLLQNGLNTSVTNHKGNTALMNAIQLLHQWPNKAYRNDFIKLLVRYKADLNVQNQNGDTALHIASKMGDLETIRVLIRAKARLDLTNKQDMTPIQVAKAMSGNIPPVNANLKWYWYFSFSANQYKIIRLLQNAEKQSRSCNKAFM